MSQRSPSITKRGLFKRRPRPNSSAAVRSPPSTVPRPTTTANSNVQRGPPPRHQVSSDGPHPRHQSSSDEYSDSNLRPTADSRVPPLGSPPTKGVTSRVSIPSIASAGSGDEARHGLSPSTIRPTLAREELGRRPPQRVSEQGH